MIVPLKSPVKKWLEEGKEGWHPPTRPVLRNIVQTIQSRLHSIVQDHSIPYNLTGIPAQKYFV